MIIAQSGYWEEMRHQMRSVLHHLSAELPHANKRELCSALVDWLIIEFGEDVTRHGNWTFPITVGWLFQEEWNNVSHPN